MTSDLSFDWELVNRLPKIQTEAEFSELMFEHFVGFPPSGGRRNYAHGRRRQNLFLFAKKSHQNLSLLNVKCAARISTPGVPLYIRGRGCAPGISKTTAIELNKVLKPYPCGSGNN